MTEICECICMPNTVLDCGLQSISPFWGKCVNNLHVKYNVNLTFICQNSDGCMDCFWAQWEISGDLTATILKSCFQTLEGSLGLNSIEIHYNVYCFCFAVLDSRRQHEKEIRHYWKNSSATAVIKPYKYNFPSWLYWHKPLPVMW